jgi:hypothetical protein
VELLSGSAGGSIFLSEVDLPILHLGLLDKMIPHA